MGKYSCSHRAAVLSMFTFSRPKHCGEEEKEKKTLLEQSQVQEEETRSCKVSDLWSLLKKDKVTILTDLKETQLSNPQTYKFDIFPRGGRKKLRIWVNSIHPGGWV